MNFHWTPPPHSTTLALIGPPLLSPLLHTHLFKYSPPNSCPCSDALFSKCKLHLRNPDCKQIEVSTKCSNFRFFFSKTKFLLSRNFSKRFGKRERAEQMFVFYLNLINYFCFLCEQICSMKNLWNPNWMSQQFLWSFGDIRNLHATADYSHHPVWPDLAKNYHLGKILKDNWQFFMSLFWICQNFETTLAILMPLDKISFF